MKLRLSTRRETAMTLFEVGVVVAVVLILAAVFLPRARISHSPETYCINNLKQVGLAYRIWEGDNGDKYPMGISVTNGGSMEMVATGDVVQTFLSMSNELSTPKILLCPVDATRSAALTFDSRFGPRNISYFVGVNVTNDLNPQSVLSGDSDLALAGKSPFAPGLVALATNAPIEWSNSRHTHKGNIGLADGSVQSVGNAQTRQIFIRTEMATNVLAIP